MQKCTNKNISRKKWLLIDPVYEYYKYCQQCIMTFRNRLISMIKFFIIGKILTVTEMWKVNTSLRAHFDNMVMSNKGNLL